MPGRPPLPVGTHGSISAKKVGGGWRARCYVRDADGRRREVVRTASSKTAALWAVQEALKTRPAFSGSDITAESLISAVAEAWFAAVQRDVDEGQKSPGTYRTYLSAWTNHIEPGIGALRCRECTVARLEGFLVELGARKMASGQRKSVKTVTSGIIGHATRLGALPLNPVRDTSRIVATAKRRPRALTAQEIVQWLDYVHEREQRAAGTSRPDVQDLYSLTLMMLATGVRISEMLAVRVEDVSLDEGTVNVSHRIRRVTGKGLQRARRQGSKGEAVLLRLPSWALTLVKRRRLALGGTGPLFPSTVGTWRDPSNTSRAFRVARDGAGFSWMTTHNFRKTVATLLDDAGLPARLVADQMTHKKVSMTQDLYLGRGVVGDRAAQVLEALDPARRISGE
jgi:integrase